MSLINGDVIPLTGGAYEVEQSLRLNDNDSAYLEWTPSSAGNRQKWTWSAWIKRANIETNETLFAAKTNTCQLWLSGVNGVLRIEQYDGSGGYDFRRQWDGYHRDPGAWYHLVVIYDSAQATEADRIKCYRNGEQLGVNYTYETISQNYESEFNNTEPHWLGRLGSQYFDGYMGEVHFIDGQALDASNFGESGDYGEWKPIEYEGTYGDNGFYLPFKQDYAVEGFSTTIYNGNSSNQYIGGVGFSPDLLWIKNRNNTENNLITNTLSGAGSQLRTNTTGAETTYNYIDYFANDGWYMDTALKDTNYSTYTYVAWAWDMGSKYGIQHDITVNGSVAHSTTQSKIGDSSISFPGADGDFLSISDNTHFNFYNADWTIEAWVYVESFSTVNGFYSQRTYGSYGAISTSVNSSNKLQIVATTDGANPWDLNIQSTTTISADTWTHIAFQKKGDEVSLWIDGTKDATTGTFSGAFYNDSNDIHIGDGYDDDQEFDGYMDEFRLSNIARYDADFTPSTTAYTEDLNTVLLIHSDTTDGSTTFTDSSGYGKNTDGDITSYVAANPDYGQSIVSYTGTGTAGDTVGHGLSSAPELVIVKGRENTNHWTVYSDAIGGGTKFLDFNQTNAVDTSTSVWNDTDTTSSVFTVGTNSRVNTSSSDYIAYCWHSVSGYSKIGSYTGTGVSGLKVTTDFKPAFVIIKVYSVTDSWFISDIVRDADNPNTPMLFSDRTDSENTARTINFVDDGFELTNTSTSHNNNGETYLYIAFADTRDYAYWLDQSGNNNDWTSKNLTESDISVDSPTNNFCVMNPLDRNNGGVNPTLSEGNLNVTNTASGTAWDIKRATFAIPSSGKWYWEVRVNSQTGLASGTELGIIDDEDGITNQVINEAVYGYEYRSSGTKGNNGTQPTYGDAYTDDDIIGIACNADDGEITFYKNNVSQGVAYTGVPYSTRMLYPAINLYTGYSISLTANFGQDSSFAGKVPAQGNTDSNNIGDFYYEPPSDYLALCTANLPEPDVIPSEHFNTVLWTGNGSSSRAITGVGFQPDFVWEKSRSDADQHNLVDAVRGTTKILYSSLNGAEVTDTDRLLSFDSDGFTIGDDLSWNDSTPHNYVAWCWKANGSGSSNTNGDITSTVSANQDAGFSIITYTGTGTDGDTVGHGLSSAPELLLAKDRTSATEYFAVYHKDLGSGEYLSINSNTVSTNTNRWTSTAPTSSVFSVGTNKQTNYLNYDYVCYAFHSVDGFSKVGTYQGNNSTNGTFVYTGFRPAFVLVKNIDSAEDWWLQDSARDPYNDIYWSRLSPSLANAETSNSTTGEDFLSNGFKFRTSNNGWNNGDTFVYIAFAETPFKYSNAR